MSKWYYYLHENGDIIGKNPVVVESDSEYFDSPFVKRVWLVSDRPSLYTMVLEALDLGAQKIRVQEMAHNQGMTFEDTIEMLQRVKPSPAMIRGMDRFIPEVLGKSVEEFWGHINKLAEDQRMKAEEDKRAEEKSKRELTIDDSGVTIK